jgi:hypothetical protein
VLFHPDDEHYTTRTEEKSVCSPDLLGDGGIEAEIVCRGHNALYTLFLCETTRRKKGRIRR